MSANPHGSPPVPPNATSWYTDPQHARLDGYLDQRRRQLHLQWKDLAKKAALSDQGIRELRKGKTQPRIPTMRALEDELGWERGSIDATLAGGEPAIASQDGQAPTPADGNRLLADAFAPLDTAPSAPRMAIRRVDLHGKLVERVDQIWEKDDAGLHWVYVARWDGDRQVAVSKHPVLDGRTPRDVERAIQDGLDEYERKVAGFDAGV
ncbi:helix-turn-helix domain-containing protein [Allonocardiopsis opalescens]|uniref:Helix-turn-helix protein n=1 Tax=Allonocardiopsis opalescens TaxID=1144618 RepID=A0A2T0PP74_9ACTN|nr:helix-turn-helix transcriptional regulator [Allonocardiopsis opalescens]PRX90701.1 helix-turn-helix protein [Allonocardiopsis opalescens]